MTEKTTIVVERLPGDKIRVSSSSWEDTRVILKDQVLEVRNVDGRLHIARKPDTTTSVSRRSRHTIPTGAVEEILEA